MMRYWIMVWVMVLSVGVSADVTPKLTVSVVPQQVNVGDTVTVKIAVSGPDLSGLAPIQVPPIPGLTRIHSSDETVVKPHGDAVIMTKTRIIQFQVVQSGRIRIPGLQTQLLNHVLRSAPVQLNASGGQSDLPTAVTLVSEVSERRVVVGQAVGYRLIIRRSGPFLATPTIRFPLFEGFFQVIHPVSNAVTKRQVDSQVWYETIALDRTLYPSQPGRLMIRDAALTVPNDAVGGSKTVIDAAPVAIEVLPLPSPKPPGFIGVVGEYSLSVPGGVMRGTQYAPIPITITVRGSGNLRVVSDLIVPSVKNGKFVKGTVATQVAPDGRVVAQRLTYMAVFQTSGNREIPPFKLVAFSPKAGRYVTLKTRPIPIQISAGRSAVSVLDAQTQLPLRPLRSVSHETSVGSNGLNPAWFWAVMGVEWAAVLGVLGYQIVQRRRLITLPERRRHRAVSVAQARLKQMGTDQLNSLSALRSIVVDCLDHRFDLRVATYPLGTLSAHLSQLPESLRDQIVNWLTEVDYWAYQPTSVSQGVFQKLLKDATCIINAIDQQKGASI